jgi:hypothetical protein
MPANAGVERLVPPTIHQPLTPQQPLVEPWTGVLSNTQAPVSGSASNDKSGTPREFPTMLAIEV